MGSACRELCGCQHAFSRNWQPPWPTVGVVSFVTSLRKLMSRLSTIKALISCSVSSTSADSSGVVQLHGLGVDEFVDSALAALDDPSMVELARR